MPATARGYPQPGYKSGASDFQSARPGGRQTSTQSWEAKLLEEIADPNLMSRKNQLILEEMLDRPVGQAVKAAVKVPGRLLPVLNAFLIGYDLTNLAIDAWAVLNTPSTDANGWWVKPNLNGYSTACRVGTGNVWTNTESACGSIAFGNGISDGGSDWHGVQPILSSAVGSAINENQRDDFSWLGGAGTYRDYRQALLYKVAGPTIDEPWYSYTAAPSAEAEEPKIPYKLIPYINPPPEPEPAPEPEDKPWIITNGPPPPSGWETELPYRRKDDKYQTKPAIVRIIGKLFGQVTEGCDFVEALFDAVPEQTRLNLGVQKEVVRYKRHPVGAPAPVRYKYSTETYNGQVYSVRTAIPNDKKGPKKGRLMRDGLGNPIVDTDRKLVFDPKSDTGLVWKDVPARRLSKVSCTKKAKFLRENWTELKSPAVIDQALQNLIANQFEDFVIGKSSKLANDAYVKTPGYNSPFGLGIGPTL